MNGTKVHHFASNPPESPYCPYWNFIIAEKVLDIDVEELGKLILERQSEKYLITDGPTGCDSYFFNVLKWDSPVCKQLHQEIIKFHDEYLKGTNQISTDNLKIRCWSNVMSKGDQIQRHCHDDCGYAYLSGHLQIKCEDTTTNYYHPYNNNSVYPIENVPGAMTLFPSWVPHDTSVHQGDSERVISAFDIYLEGNSLSSMDHGGEVNSLR